MRLEEPRTPTREIPPPSVLPINMNEAELDQLFASCIPRLQRTARLMLRDPQDSEDAVQEGLLLAFRNLKQFQGRSSFSTWLHSILRNVARTHYRRTKCRPKCSLEEELSDEKGSKFEQHFLDPRPTPEQECELGERSRLLSEIVQELPSGYAFAMKLCDVDGLEPRDASQILGISSSALKTCLFRARRIAARRLRARFCPPIQGMPINKNSGSQPHLGPPFRMSGSPLAMRNSLETRRNIQSTRGRAKESKLYEAPMNREEKGHTSGKAIWRLLVLSTLLCATLSLRSANAADGALTVPRGTILPVRLNSTISSDKSKSGQVITGRIMQDVPLASGTVLRAGSKVIGHILDVSSASNGGQARVSFQFDKLIASGRTIPIKTNLRAVAEPMTVMQVEVSNSSLHDYFLPSLIGGDIAYQSGGCCDGARWRGGRKTGERWRTGSGARERPAR